VNWANSVVIFDEAHNIEGIASDSASSEISSTDIGGSISEIDQCIAKAQEVGYGSESITAPPDLGSLLIMKQVYAYIGWLHTLKKN
jgi:Rad3-related DNA helicase